MQIVFSRSKYPLSALIMWAFNEPVSHTAFVFDDKWLFQSNLLGMNVHWLRTWQKTSTVVDCITYDLTIEQEEEIFQSLLDQYSDEEYDFCAFAYFGWRAFLLKFFGVPMPKTGRNGKGYLCTEVAGLLPQWLTKLPKDVDLSITTPWQLRDILKAAKGE